MALVVQKYGGTSVGSIERIRNVAERVGKTFDQGNQVIVVLSAMAGETNRLVALAHEMFETPDEREYDVLVSTVRASVHRSPDYLPALHGVQGPELSGPPDPHRH